ncbi:MAG: hypothetical protein DHS80DRAFT_28739 [Piptocephalis tieghemiana]|nr:MAG: hypothetical protein DHS80DRAFT_28739 [Piptocephalis tieghemiana]
MQLSFVLALTGALALVAFADAGLIASTETTLTPTTTSCTAATPTATTSCTATTPLATTSCTSTTSVTAISCTATAPPTSSATPTSLTKGKEEVKLVRRDIVITQTSAVEGSIATPTPPAVSVSAPTPESTYFPAQTSGSQASEAVNPAPSGHVHGKVKSTVKAKKSIKVRKGTSNKRRRHKHKKHTTTSKKQSSIKSKKSHKGDKKGKKSESK